MKLRTPTRAAAPRRRDRNSAASKRRMVAAKRAARQDARDLADQFPDGFDAAGVPLSAHPSDVARFAHDLPGFASHYLPRTFFHPHSPGQVSDLQTMQKVAEEGGQYAFAAPRGDGKTCRVEACAMWAVLYGYRRFVVIVGAEIGAAREMLESVKSEFESNESLRADFPGVCVPVEACDRKALRARQFTLHGQPLHFQWAAEHLALPWIPGLPSSGAIIVARGLKSRIRGMSRKLPNGDKIRPDLALPDDPQTDESAASDSQCDTREALITGAILGTGGRSKPIAAFMATTTKRKGDLSDRFLDRQRHPEWQGRRRSMVVKWPDAQETLWAEYAEIRKRAQIEGDGSAARGTEFYLANRAAMDAGAELDNESRTGDTGAESALQNAENLLCDRGQMVFFSEYQNDPDEAAPPVVEINPLRVRSQLNGLQPREVPAACRWVLAFVDVNLYGLHWLVSAFRPDAAGYVLDYGKYPPGESSRLFAKDGTDGTTEEQAVFNGLSILVDELANKRAWLRDGKRQKLSAVWIDCGYLPDAVYQYCQAARLPTEILPARGYAHHRYRPTSKYGRIGKGWNDTQFRGEFPGVAVDVDLWRRLSQEAWLQEVGASGSASLFGRNPEAHLEFARQVTRERLMRIEQTGTGDRYCWEGGESGAWHDLGDCLTGVCAMADRAGASVISPRLVQRSAMPRRNRTARVSVTGAPSFGAERFGFRG